MKNIICAIAKNEENYIRDFCLYHLGIGFDEVHVYDNDPALPLKALLSGIPAVVVHPWKSVADCQMRAYRDCMEHVEYDWCAYVDVDEFITLNGPSDISEFINGLAPNIECVHLFERVYGDGGKVEPEDITVPVYERLTEPSAKYWKVFFKNLIRKGAPGSFPNPHVLGHDAVTANSDGKISTRWRIADVPSAFVEGAAYIRHYKTKTLAEFCTQKLETSRVFVPGENRHLAYFTEVNEMTPEKIQYLNDRGIAYP